MKRLVNLSLILLCAALCIAQAPPAALLPIPRVQFLDASGRPLAGGLVYTFSAGTSTPLATFTTSVGDVQNQNPILLDAGGFASIWIGPQAYKIDVRDSFNAQQYVVDNVSDPGQLLYSKAILLSPLSAALQTVVGPLAANYFQGVIPKTTSPGVRVNLLDPVTTLDTTLNPPTVTTTQPALAGQNYTVPDPGTPTGNFVISPGTTSNTLDCTATGLNCKRTAYMYLEGGGCNNTTAASGWDTFGSNSPTPTCITGTNIQKGLLAFPSAATRYQESSGTGVAAGTCTLTYNAATQTGDLLAVAAVVDGGKTVTGVTDGVNAYTLAAAKTNGNLDLELWYFNGNSTSRPATTTLTVTLSAAANCALNWTEYMGILTAGMLDVTASANGTGTSVTTGTTAGTAQAKELALAVVGTVGGPAIGPAAGWVQHTGVLQGTNLALNSQGQVFQATQTASSTFALSTSSAWASLIATFKVNVGGPVTAQRHIVLPSTFLAATPINSHIKYQAGQFASNGPASAVLGASLMCTSDGNTDDSVFNTATTATANINPSGVNLVSDQALNALTATGCAPGNMLHYQIQRNRYAVGDNFEGWVYVDGANLSFGISQ